METKRITKELKYLLDDDDKGRCPKGIERNSEVVIRNRFHQSNLYSEIRTSESSISNLTNFSLMLSESSQVLKDDNVNYDYSIIINLKDLKKICKKIFHAKNAMKTKSSKKLHIFFYF